MNEFLVNAKTDMLEFKRKHNLLVGASSFKVGGQTNITTLSDEILNNLKCGDMVIKKTGNLNHTYIVTYKEENHGICLSYFAAGYTETVSYDFTDGHWVYNSTDVKQCGFEDITDSEGHKRFIEGNLNIATQTGLTINFAKWSLSGSHLMIVVAGSVSANNQATLSLNTEIALPQWIKEKIYPLGHGDNVAYSTIFLYNDSTFEVSEESAILIKPSGGELGIYHNHYIGDESAEIDFRVQFDLLIDNE